MYYKSVIIRRLVAKGDRPRSLHRINIGPDEVFQGLGSDADLQAADAGASLLSSWVLTITSGACGVIDIHLMMYFLIMEYTTNQRLIIF